MILNYCMTYLCKVRVYAKNSFSLFPHWKIPLEILMLNILFDGVQLI